MIATYPHAAAKCTTVQSPCNRSGNTPVHKQSSYTYIYNKLANHIIYLLNPTGGVLYICTYLCTVYTVYVWCYIMHVHTHALNMHKVLFHSYIYTYICRYLATHYIYIVDNMFTLDHDLKPKDTFNNQA